MTKRCIALLLTLAMLFTCGITAVAAKEEVTNLLRNGDMETVMGGKIMNWTQKGGEWSPSTEVKRSGETSIRCYDDGADEYAYIQQMVKVVPGTTYEITGYAYPVDMGAEGGAAVKVEMYKYNDQGKSEYLDKKEQNYRALTANKWNKVGFKLTVPDNCVEIGVLYRMNHGVEIYYDDLEILGEKPPVGEPLADKNYVPALAGSEELLTNASFEELNADGFPKDWDAYQGWSKDSTSIQLKSNGGYDGKNTIEIIGSGNPWVSQKVYKTFKKGEVYQLSVWYRIQSAGGIGFKCEWHDTEDVYMGGHNTEYKTGITGEQWVQYVYHMEIPNDCSRITFLIRNFNASGLVEVDQASFYKIKNPRAIFIDTDKIFFYTEEANAGKYCHASATIAAEEYPEIVGRPFSFRVKDGDKVIYEAANIYAVDGKATHNFRMSVLPEEWKQYKLEVAIVGDDGKDMQAESINIYKYPRPTILNENNKVVIGGKEMNPTVWYHVDIEDYPKLAAAGGTVVQSRYETPDGIMNCLEAAEKAGIMVMAALYRNMKPAGHPDNIANTENIIAKVKDHPALLGYMVMDEPSSKFANKLELFEESYKLIRTLDPHHVVYTVEASPTYYRDFSKYVDVLAVDPYPGIVKGGATIDHVLKYNGLAQEVIQYERPIWSINQATGYQYLVPDEAAIRNMFYSALYGGATAVGHYAWYDKTEWMGDKMFHQTENLQGMTNVYSNGDTETAYAHFVDRKYPIFKEQTFDNYWVSSYVRDGELYMYLGNRGPETVNVSLPLVSDGGAVSIGDYSAVIVYGDTNVNSVRIGSGTLEFAIDGNAAYLLKITPSSPVNFAALKTTKYRDTYVTPWAAEAIREVESRGIVNDFSTTSFAPQKKITRGEFAYFLIRTLGLTSTATENFADVEADAFYAKELAIGKALGILNGVGNNMYNPEAEISRQDFMTIIARGMQLSGAGADLSAFADAGLIADYAKDAVGAMVVSGLVKGNADGTMNPLGNTTRAEAAVIMQRILYK